MLPIVIDFETFYDTKGGYTLKKMSTPEYIMDRRFKVFGMAVDYGDTQEFVHAKDIAKWLKAHKNDVIVAHNAFFDAGILVWRYKFKPAYMLDTLLLANHVLGSARESGSGKNDLKTLGAKLGLEIEKGEELKMFDGVREPSPMLMRVLAEYAKNDVKMTRQIFDILLPQITNPEFELWLLDHTLRIYTEKMLGVDLEKLEVVKVKVETRRTELVKASGTTPAVLNSNPQFAAELIKRLKAVGIKTPMKKAKRKDGSTPLIPALAKGDPAFIALADNSNESVSSLVKARLVERSAVTVAARLATMERYAKLGLGIPVHLVYYGAHTGRFSGGGGFNFQNLTSPGRAVDPVEAEIAALVRECIVPHPSEKDLVLVAVDAAQIEARVEAWLAGEDLITDAFARGADIYSEFISEAINEDIHKPTLEEKVNKKLVSYLSLMRQVGKEAILGLGYSMGVDKFRERLRKEKNLVPLLEDGQKLSAEVCTEIVTSYREKYGKIVQFWADLNKAFNDAIRGATRQVGDGKLTFMREGDRVVSITLPSGRKLYYRNLRQEAELTKTGMQRKVWKHGNGQRIYGGLIAENVTQAVARDILVESIRHAENADYPVVLHVHDEIVSRVSTVRGPAALDFITKQLSTPPTWGKGLVLSAEGHIAVDLSK